MNHHVEQEASGNANRKKFYVCCEAGTESRLSVDSKSLSVTVSQRIRRGNREEMWDSVGVFAEENDEGVLVIRVLIYGPEWELRRAQEQLQDEQRRIARELHDSTAQELAGLRMNLGVIKRSSKKLDRKAVRALTECKSLAEQCAREIRTLSYLLHPPLLDEFGLVLALRGYVQGFAKRSGIRVGLDIDPRLEQSRLPQRFETSLFRIVQESLTNISRHSGSQSATIRLQWKEDEVMLEIQDRGRGIKAEVVRAIASGDVTALGVGIPGMRERVRQLEGKFRIETNQHGTSLSVALPVKHPSCATQETTTASTATN
jgi:signal transduction histidine kinase